MTTLSVSIEWDVGCFETDSGNVIDGLDLERSGFSITLGCSKNLYSVTTHTSRDATFYVVDDETEAKQLFKEQIAYCIYELGCDDVYEKKEAEKILKKYGFYEDAKRIYKIISDMLPDSVSTCVSDIREELKNEKKLGTGLIDAVICFLTENEFLKREYKDCQTFYRINRVANSRTPDEMLEEIDQPISELEIPRPPPVMNFYKTEIEKIKNVLPVTQELLDRARELIKLYQPTVDKYIDAEIVDHREKPKMADISTGVLHVNLRKDMLPENIIGACFYVASEEQEIYFSASSIAQAQGHNDTSAILNTKNYIERMLKSEKNRK